MAFSQSFNGKMALGFQTGVNRSNLYVFNQSEFADRTEAIYRYNVALFGSYFLASDWSIKTKIMLENKGFGSANALVYGDIIVETDYKLGYLTVPTLVSWHFGKENVHYLGLGPYLGFLMSAENGFEDNDLVKEDFKNADFGLHFNAGTTKRVGGSIDLLMELGSSIGLNRINKKDSSLLLGARDDVYRNMVVYLNIGIVFNGFK